MQVVDTHRLRRIAATTEDLDLRVIVESLFADIQSRVTTLSKAERRDLAEDLRVIKKAIHGWRNVPPHAGQTKVCLELLLEIAETRGWARERRTKSWPRAGD